jgi:hypothetical protein
MKLDSSLLVEKDIFANFSGNFHEIKKSLSHIILPLKLILYFTYSVIFREIFYFQEVKIFLMHNSKLISHLKGLTRVELTRLRDFVHSPYYNKHGKVIELMDVIYEVHPHLDSPKLAKEHVFNRLYPNQPFSYTQLAHLMSYLQTLTEQFMATEQLNDDAFLMNHLALRRMKPVVPAKIYERKLLKTNKMLSQNTGRTSQHFYYQSMAEGEMDAFYITRKRKTEANYLQRKSDSMDQFFIASKLEYWCDMLNRSNVLNIQYEYPLMEEILKLIESDRAKYLAEPFINIYYHILQTLRQPEKEEHYSHLIDYLSEYSARFDKEDAKAMYDYAQNYCIKRINKGDSDYLEELLKLYQLMLEHGLIYENGYFPSSDFKNIVTISCRLKKYNWAEDFIHRYESELESSIRTHVSQYNLATCYFEQGDYDSALALLQKVEFTDTYFALGARSMLMKIYFELDEEEPLFSHIDSFQTYLRRNKIISAYQRKVHQNFIRFTKKAFQLKEALAWKRKKEMEKQANSLFKHISQTEDITNKNWLEQEVKKLMASQKMEAPTIEPNT